MQQLANSKHLTALCETVGRAHKTAEHFSQVPASSWCSCINAKVTCMPLMQPCLERTSLGRKQTLTYLKGYQHESSDLAGLMSCEGPARSSLQNSLAGSSKSSTGTASPTCSSPLPRWVEQDRQVRSSVRDNCTSTVQPAESVVAVLQGMQQLGLQERQHACR